MSLIDTVRVAGASAGAKVHLAWADGFFPGLAAKTHCSVRLHRTAPALPGAVDCTFCMNSVPTFVDVSDYVYRGRASDAYARVAVA